MKTLFIIIGLVISLSLIGMLISLIGLVFVEWPPLRSVLNVLFLVLIISSVTFVVTLMVIPHGRIE
jgi:hypothetical protein